MYSIGDFSRLSGLTIKTLRFYHKRGLLIPAQVDEDSGYRYYNGADLEVARVIVALRALEFSLDDILAILAECRDDEDMLVYLERHKEAMAKKLAHYQEIHQTIEYIVRQEHAIRETLRMAEQTFEIVEKDVEPLLIAGLRMQGKYSEIGNGFAKLGKRVGWHVCGKPFCLYYDCEYREDDANFEPCFPIRKTISAEGIEVRTLPAVRCVSLQHHGPYEALSRCYARVMDYIQAKGYEIVGPTREIYLKGPGMLFKGNPKKYLTEIQFPIKSGQSGGSD